MVRFGSEPKVAGFPATPTVQFRSWTAREGLSNDFVRTLPEDAGGNIWAGTDNGLLRLDGDRFVRVDGSPDMCPRWPCTRFTRIARVASWVGGSRLLRFKGSAVTEYTLRGEASQNRVKSIMQTQDGTMWVGTVSGLEPHGAPARTQFRAGQRNYGNRARPAPNAGWRVVDRHHRAGRFPEYRGGNPHRRSRLPRRCPATRC